MEKSVGTAIEKIKLQEQDKEAKLKEKREYEATVTSLKRSIREAASQIEKYQEEIKELSKGNDCFRAQLEVERIRRNAVAEQVEACNKEIEALRSQSDRGISQVWELRSSLCSSVQNVSDECDIWALLAKPMNAEPLYRVLKKSIDNDNNEEELGEERLKLAKERRQKAMNERERLLAEPEKGEEFVRACIQQQRTGRSFSTKLEANENEPIKFSTSSAARKTIKPIAIKSKPSDMPWYQPYSVLASVTVFLVYFCVLREESDVDLEFNKTLYERIKGLEKEQLLQSYRYNKENGLSVIDIEKRLKEIEIDESKALA